MRRKAQQLPRLMCVLREQLLSPCLIIVYVNFFQMMLRNNVSRFHVAAHAVRGGGRHNAAVSTRQHQLVSLLMTEVSSTKAHILSKACGKFVSLYCKKLGS